MSRGAMSPEDHCPRCDLRTSRCVCAELPAVHTRTRLIVIRHGREVRKPSGTARIAALAIPGLELIDYRDEAGATPPRWLADERELARTTPVLPPEAVAARILAMPTPHLLFPTGKPLDPAAPPPTLIVLDGTWRQARAMFQRIPGLSALPALRLTGPAPAADRLRRPVREGERSTLEAIAEAIALLEGEALAAPLHALHARFVRTAVTARWGRAGRPPRAGR